MPKTRKPSHRVYAQHDPDNSKARTEVGALWPHERGGGYGLTIRKGLALVGGVDGVHYVAFEIDEERERERARERADQRGHSERGREERRSSRKNDGDDDIPF